MFYFVSLLSVLYSTAGDKYPKYPLTKVLTRSSNPSLDEFCKPCVHFLLVMKLTFLGILMYQEN